VAKAIAFNISLCLPIYLVSDIWCVFASHMGILVDFLSFSGKVYDQPSDNSMTSTIATAQLQAISLLDSN